jgi:phospholipid/cholesterol/gamma-HCH transport system substrate-binding protein
VNTTAPGKSKIFVMVAFAASCVGLLLFLWISFGGSVPFVPQGYRITVEFNQAVQLGTQADVDIAGVSIGKVVDVGLDRKTGLTKAVLQIDPRYAPRPADTRAILREKTLLGETYVELSFGNPDAPMLRDGARLPQGQVSPTVQLDQILNTFDPRTRQAFETWMQDDGMAFTDRGEDFNDALAQLVPFSSNVNNVLEVLRRDAGATSTLLSDGGRVLSAISQNPAQLQGVIRNSDSVFAATAAQSDELAASVKAFPGFLASTRETLASIKRFAGDANPLVTELQPAATPLSDALEQSARLAPALKAVMVGIGPLTRAAQAGIPALEAFLNVSAGAGSGSSKTLFASLTPFLGQLVPVIDYIDAYRSEIATFFANSTAATQAAGQSFDSATERLHYVRVSAPLSPEELTAESGRPYSNRGNAYPDPGSGSALTASSALDVFGSYLCTSNPLPSIPSGGTATVQYQSELPLFYGGAADATKVPAPACTAQQELSDALRAELGGSLGPTSGFYPQLQPLP